MGKRDIITIDEEKCTGCGTCASGCPEGAIQIIDDKARLVSDIFCDGLGACIGTCPENAITIEKRDAEPYDEKKVMANIVQQGPNTIKAHLHHLETHGQKRFHQQAIEFLMEHDVPVPGDEQPGEDACEHAITSPATNEVACGCPGSSSMTITRRTDSTQAETNQTRAPSELQNWPIQLTLINPAAEYFDNADVLVAADCTAFTLGSFHQDLLQGKVLVIFCPKLDADIEAYTAKLAEIFTTHDIKSITMAHMQVPCCFGLKSVVNDALKAAGKDRSFPVKEIIISQQGEIMPDVVRFFKM
ncbi:MAG TPA: 4Fe-4S binding protein [Candidatus Lokiarchaeia archaeon]|nr:4Fe-4S binding protein [Candidatus Lokiarchaeia archaeon]